MSAVAQSGPATRLARLPALDWMRGLVMILMAVDHSSDAFNAGRLFTDAAFLYRPCAPLPAAQFLTRWITHLCAPTFLFLAGTGLAFTVARQRDQGVRARDTDRYLLVRGLVIAAFELWISFFVMPKGRYLLQVLYGIGSSYLCMIPLRRLPDRVAVAVALGLVVAGEALTRLATAGGAVSAPLPLALLLVGGQRPHLVIAYPTIPWLAILLLGWGWGRSLVTRPAAREGLPRKLALSGLGALLIFAVVRGADGYGNMGLLRAGSSPLQWLHVSKYPPSVTYVALELGLACLCLSALFAFTARRSFRPNGVVLTLGQTPMFFYLLHFPLLILAARALHVEGRLGLRAAYTGAALVVAALYPACRWYRGYKAAYRAGWPRYI
jgi:uncharacterized membrane protein